VACPTTSWCEAAGQLKFEVGTKETYIGLAEQLTAGPAVAAALPLAHAVGPPAPPPNPVIPDPQIACPAAGTCVAVADYPVAGFAQDAVTAVLLNGAWKVKPAPLPASAAGTPDTSLVGLACHSTSNCVAVGGYQTASGLAPLIETWTKKVWTATAGPLPSGATSPAWLNGVACWAGGSCVAVGLVTTGSFATAPLVEQLSTTWSATEPGLPATAVAGSAGLLAVSCVIHAVCAAGGQFTDTGANGQGLAETS
jgi:hypothetical protein